MRIQRLTLKYGSTELMYSNVESFDANTINNKFTIKEVVAENEPLKEHTLTLREVEEISLHY